MWLPAAHHLGSGRPQASDIQALQRAGVREVIELNVDNETPGFAEAAAMRAASIDYRHLAILGSADLTPATVARFDRLLNGDGERTTLVRCASSDWLCALIALRAALIGGQSTKDAVAEGQRWGLKSLQPVVRDRLEARRTRRLNRPSRWSGEGHCTGVRCAVALPATA